MERPPTAGRLLEAWEHARSQTPVARALTLLALAVPEAPAEALSRYPVGRRDQELLGLRERIFGPRMTGSATCPACSQAVDVDFSVGDVRAPAPSDPDQIHEFHGAGFEVRFRLPRCADLASLDPAADPRAQRAALLHRCVVDARLDGEPAAADSLPEPVAAALSGRMAELDPQGDVQLNLTCPSCGHLWTPPLDIVSYLWNEIQAWAPRMLRDVHAIASAYGWREADILAMGAWRRQAYLEMIRQ